MSSNRRFKSSLELSTSASGSPLIARPDAVVGNSTQTSIGHSQKHLLKKFATPFERYQNIHSFPPYLFNLCPVNLYPASHLSKTVFNN